MQRNIENIQISNLKQIFSLILISIDEPTILVKRETKRWMKLKQSEEGGIRTFLSLRHLGREANEDVPPKLSSYLVPQLRTPSFCSSLSLSFSLSLHSNGMLALSLSPAPFPRPS